MLLVNNIDISEIATDVKYQSQWNNGADMLTFSYPSDKAAMHPNGCTVIFTYGGTNVFYGFLFKTQQNRTEYKCTCYDQRRYLKAKNSLIRGNETLTSFLNAAAYSCGDRIRLGTVEETELKLSKYLFDNKTYLDMVYQSIQDNLVANGYYYTLRDNFGALELRDTVNLRIPLVLGDASLATDFDYLKSIDDDTYNYIKVAKDDKEKGVRNVYIAQDSSAIAQWGKLMLYEKVSAELNDAQLADRANQLLQLKNRESEELKIECVGDIRVTGGTGIKVEIAQAGISLWAVVNNVTHEFGKNLHTMKADLLFGR